jgi:signal transduction histidine kinase
VIGLIVFGIIIMQAVELLAVVPSSFHLFELIVFLVILLTGSLFLELLLRSSASQARTLNILDIKHSLSMVLAGSDDWDLMVHELASFPGSVTGVEASSLYVRDSISGQFEHAAHWHKDGIEAPAGYLDDQASPTWVAQMYSAGQIFHRCPPRAGSDLVEYCMPIRQGENLLAFLRFCMQSGANLSRQAVDVINNVGDEMALALRAGQTRKTSYAMTSSQAALAERQMVSHYLHDNLAQNLGYVRLKLDQLLMERDHLSIDQIGADLERMRDAANESYEVVRGALENIHPKTLPHLMNLLQQYVNKVAERANFVVNFEVRGRPFPLKDDVQSAIFYVCHEVLSNVEKHSHADCVDIFADWCENQLTLTISDNGVGFNPQAVDSDKHFGLEIVNERINNINGRITLQTSQDSGTVISITVPTHPVGHL